jgi:hypothetical protein
MKVLNQPNIDFITFHPYPNADWLKYTLVQTRALIQGIVHDGHKLGKPVVMEEWNVQKNIPIKDPDHGNEEVQATDPALCGRKQENERHDGKNIKKEAVIKMRT